MMVSAAVAGDDLQGVAGSASKALGCPVAIAIPALGSPVLWPVGAAPAAAVAALAAHAEAVTRGEEASPPGPIAELVPVRIGQEVAGVVAAFGDPRPDPDRRSWLEAAAAAAAVAALMHDSQSSEVEGSTRELLIALAFKAPSNTDALLAHARRLGFELEAGAIALCARWSPGQPVPTADPLPTEPAAMVAEAGDGRVLGLVPVGADDRAPALAAELTARGATVALSSPRRDPSDLHEALREAELMVELGDGMLVSEEETYRLLIGVLLRDPAQLKELRSRTVSPLLLYDAEHDTELLATLRAFLAHHGSTTETADAMHLHRHTVGYRLARVHEVSGLSPYESDGRERLGLGLKADQILEADHALSRDA
jgi:hypothetical protein